MAFIFRVLDSVLAVYMYIVLIRCVVSWFQPDPYNKLYQLLIELTEPVMEPVRRIMPRLGMIDLSPIVVIIVINILRGMIQYAYLAKWSI